MSKPVMKVGKTYLGDAVYADMDEHGILWLHTSDGLNWTNEIALEPSVWIQLLTFMRVTDAT